MEGFVIGMDLTDLYTHICCADPEAVWIFPTTVCRLKKRDEWFVDEEAYAHALLGDGVVEDKLLTLLKRQANATIGDVTYSALDLLKRFFAKVLEYALKELGGGEIAALVVTVERFETRLMDSIMYCADFCGIPRERVHIISHTEAFVYYLMNKKRDVWNNQAALFSLENENLTYSEMRAQFINRRLTVTAETERMEESIQINVLDTPSGQKLADRILCSVADRLVGKRMLSSIFLTGKGFENVDWAVEFKKKIGTRRRVYGENSLFARGAAARAVGFADPEKAPAFACVCDGHLKTNIAVRIKNGGKESQMPLCGAGDNWYETRVRAEFIVADEPEITFYTTAFEGGKKNTISIDLSSFPGRPDRTTRILLGLAFKAPDTMLVEVKDLGFGDIYPASDRVIRQEVIL